MGIESEPTGADVFVVSSRREGPRAVVILGGELDLHGSDRLIEEVQRVLSPENGPIEQVELNAGELTFADSAGLRAVLMARQEAQTTGVTFTVTAVSPPVERVIEMAGLTDVLLPGRG